MKGKIVIILLVIMVILTIGILIFKNKMQIDEIEELKNSSNILEATVNEQKNEIEELKKEDSETQETMLGEGNYEEIKIDNVTPISKERAKEIIDDNCKNIVGDDVSQLHFIETKVEKVKFEEKAILIENTFLLTYSNEMDRVRPLNIIPKKTQKNVYAVYYASDGELEKMTGYVDMYTGEFLGVYQEGV